MYDFYGRTIQFFISLVSSEPSDRFENLFFFGGKSSSQGCQMVCFQTKNPNLGKFCRVLLWKILVYFMTVWSILRPLQIFYGHLVYFVVFWYIFPRFGILDQEKSGNPASSSDHLEKFPLCGFRSLGILFPSSAKNVFEVTYIPRPS
jgi:hypothetical protein